MTEPSRRAFLFSAATITAGLVAACASPEPPAPTTPIEPAQRPGPGPVAGGDRYGVGIYNTQEVADELSYIEANIQPARNTEPKRILVTGSTAGIGQLTAAYFLRQGHRVVAHARNEQRAADVRRDLANLEDVVIGDLLNLDQTRALAVQINALGRFDIIIHNAGEYGLPNPEILNANSLSTYLLTSLVAAPREQLMYLTSDLHLSGDLKLDEIRSGGTDVNYNDSKLHMATLATAVARHHAELRVNAIAPGWVPTLMGFHNGPYAPDSLRESYLTQVWMTDGTDPATQTTGMFLHHRAPEERVHADVHDEAAQDALLAAFAERTGVSLS